MRAKIRQIRILTQNFEEAEDLEDRIEIIQEIQRITNNVNSLLQTDYIESITNYKNNGNKKRDCIQDLNKETDRDMGEEE